MGSRERERRAKKKRKTQRGRNKTREEERRGQESFPLLLFLPPLPFHALFCKNRGLVPCFVLILKDWVVAFSAAGGGRRKERGETNKNLLSPSLSHISPPLSPAASSKHGLGVSLAARGGCGSSRRRRTCCCCSSRCIVCPALRPVDVGKEGSCSSSSQRRRSASSFPSSIHCRLGKRFHG
jgi:hypothetical protein